MTRRPTYSPLGILLWAVTAGIAAIAIIAIAALVDDAVRHWWPR